MRACGVLRWYLIHTKPSAEATAKFNLERQGYEIYLPRLQQAMPLRRQQRERIVPLFPRYLFLRLREGCQPLGPVRSSAGVSNVVRFGSSYAIVADEVVGKLRSRADPVSGLHRLSSPAPLMHGDAVRLAAGPFDGLEGIFQRQNGCERAVVLLSLLGQETPVCVPTEWILSRRDSWSDARLRPSTP